MTQASLPFQYKVEKKTTHLTSFSGLPLYIELAVKSGLTESIPKGLNMKTRGWCDTEIVLSLILLNLAGGDCISDIERLERDAGLRTLLQRFAVHGLRCKEKRAYEKRWRKQKVRGLPSNAAIHRYLPQFHSGEEETKREKGRAFIPSPNPQLESLIALNKPLIDYLQTQLPSSEATLDQDATLTQTHKRKALYCYKKYKAYQPFNTYWAEQGLLLHSEFRDGNVPAGYQQLRVLKESLALLPAGVTNVFLRSDSAGYQEALLQYCAEGKNSRFGVIEFAVAANVSGAFKKSVQALKPEDWQPFYKEEADGTNLKTTQEWAEVCFVPSWAAKRKDQPNYRYLAIREAMQPVKSENPLETEDLPFQTLQADNVIYKLFGVITNRQTNGNALIQWHRDRCGKRASA